MYDLIVCNPPYFEDSLPSPDPRRAEARHNVSLSYDELFECASALLTPKGRLSLIVPTRHLETVTVAARDRKLFLIRKTNVYPTSHSKVKRARRKRPRNRDVEALLYTRVQGTHCRFLLVDLSDDDTNWLTSTPPITTAIPTAL